MHMHMHTFTFTLNDRLFSTHNAERRRTRYPYSYLCTHKDPHQCLPSRPLASQCHQRCAPLAIALWLVNTVLEEVLGGMMDEVAAEAMA